MKLLQILFISVLFSLSAMAQKTAYNPEHVASGPEYDAAKQKFIELYIQQLDSESHKKSSELVRAFLSKMNYSGNAQNVAELYKDNKVVEWIRENFQKTSFASIEEAQKEYDAMMQATTASIDDNREYYEFMTQTLRTYGSQIFLEANQYVIHKHPEKLGIDPICVGK